MKISPSTFNNAPLKKKVLLPLVPEELSNSARDKLVSHSLRSTPSDADSPKCEISIAILQGDESCRQVMAWRTAALKILNGLNVTTHNAGVLIVETLVEAIPLSLFQNGIELAKQQTFVDRIANAADSAAKSVIRTEGADHDNNLAFEQVKEGLKFVVTSPLPRQIKARVKRHLRRECRKPREMSVRVHLQHLLRMNHDEIPNLPPFDPDQNLSMDELTDIILFGTPKSWQREMERQGFDPME